MLNALANTLTRRPLHRTGAPRTLGDVIRQKVRDLLFMQSAENSMLSCIAKTLDNGMTPRQRQKLAKTLVQLAKISNELGHPPKELLPILQKLAQLRFADTNPVALNKQTTRRPALRSKGKIHPKGFFHEMASRAPAARPNIRRTNDLQIRSRLNFR